MRDPFALFPKALNGASRPAVSDVPIVGQAQAAAVIACYPTAVITCQCEAKPTLVLVAAGVVTCPGCGQRFQLNGVQWTENGARVTFNIKAAAQ